MPVSYEEFRSNRDVMQVPVLWVAVALSLLIHLLFIWQWKSPMLPPSPDQDGKGAIKGALRAQLLPRSTQSAAPPPAPAAAPSTDSQAPPRRPAARSAPARNAPARPPPAPAPPPPVIALNRPGPGLPAPAPAAAPARPPAEDDLSAMIEARRRARAGPAPAPPPAAPPQPEDEITRSNRIVAANLGTLRAPAPGENSRRGGGVFQLRRVGIEDAEFLFFGWNKDMRRNTTQVVEVRKGDNANVRIAIIRRMIAIIREHEQGDFMWESVRSGNVSLSARLADSAKLEQFLYGEFF